MHVEAIAGGGHPLKSRSHRVRSISRQCIFPLSLFLSKFLLSSPIPAFYRVFYSLRRPFFLRGESRRECRENFSHWKQAKRKRNLRLDPLSLSKGQRQPKSTAVAASRRAVLEGGGGGGSSNWLPTPTGSRIAGELSLGFNGGLGGGWPASDNPPATAGGGGGGGGCSSSSRLSSQHQPIINYNGIPLPLSLPLPPDISMVGLRDVFLFHHHSSSSSSADPQTPIFPLLPPSLPPQPPLHSLPATHHLAAGILPVDNDDDEYRRKPPEIQLWHQQRAVAAAGTAPADGEFSSGASTGSATCQDCGNQAKKGCGHRRCRTCCKSRGFDCPTHVKSTWVPAARRRDRQQQLLNLSSGTTGKRLRLGSGAAVTTGSVTSTSATTPSRSFDTGSSHQELEMGGGGLPGHVTAPAVFNCVRVTALEDGEGEYAYQAVVKIGGRVFKGFLYNQGLDGSRPSSLPNLSELHLGDLNGGGCKNANSTSLSSILEATDAYAVTAAAAAAAASCSSGMLAAANYGNPIN